MSTVLDSRFLLELGAYAVAAACIRLLKHRLNRQRQPGATPAHGLRDEQVSS